MITRRFLMAATSALATPSLARADTIGSRAVLGGFGFLTLAMSTGFLWNHSLFGRFWTGDPKEWASLMAWVIYVVILAARWRGGWGGRRAAWLAIAGALPFRIQLGGDIAHAVLVPA